MWYCSVDVDPSNLSLVKYFYVVLTGEAPFTLSVYKKKLTIFQIFHWILSLNILCLARRVTKSRVEIAGPQVSWRTRGHIKKWQGIEARVLIFFKKIVEKLEQGSPS